MEQPVLDSITIWGFVGTMVGTAISIISAIIAWKQYKKALNASQAAIEAKAFFITKKNTIDLNDLLKEAKSIEAMVIGYTISNDIRLMGRNKTNDLESIQNFLSKLNELKAHINNNEIVKKELDKQYEAIYKRSLYLNKDLIFDYKILLEELRYLIGTLSSETNKNFYS